MNKRWWLNAILAALVVAAGWLVFFKTDAPEHKRFPLSTLKAAEIRDIVITRADRPPIKLLKRGDGQWMLTAPFAARADALRVENLLGILSARSEKQFPATDLARFELHTPLATVTLGPQSFAFGGTHPLSNQLYVLTNKSVYLVSPVVVVDALKLPIDYASKSLLGIDENPIDFTLPDLTLNRRDGTWQRTPADPALSQDAANRYADEWRFALASQVSAKPAGEFIATHTIHVQFANQKSVRFLFTQQDGEWQVLREDEQRIYHLSPDAAQRLLKPGT